MSQEEERKVYLRERILKLMRGVPASMGGASIQAVRDFKKIYVKMAKRLEQRSLSLAELESIGQQMDGLYK